MMSVTSVMIAHLHSVPGRVRLHVPQIKGNAAAARAVEAEFSRLTGVSRVESREVTGSVVIHYDPKATNCDALLSKIGVSSRPAVPFARQRQPAALGVPAKPSGKIAEAIVWHLVEKAVERAVPLALAAIL
jgi:hypothetical protein